MKLTFSHKRHYYRFLQITEDQSESTIIKKEVWESINHIAISVMAKTETAIQTETIQYFACIKIVFSISLSWNKTK